MHLLHAPLLYIYAPTLQRGVPQLAHVCNGRRGDGTPSAREVTCYLLPTTYYLLPTTYYLRGDLPTLRVW